MALFSKTKDILLNSVSKVSLPPFHPSTVLCQWGDVIYDINAAKTGTLITGAVGSGKSSAPARDIIRAILKNNCGALVLCSKPEEAEIWRQFCKETGRESDLIEVDETGEKWRYNFLAEETARSGDARALTMNITALLTEVAGAINKGAGKGSDDGESDKFWTDSLAHLLTNLIDLCVLSQQPVTLLRLRELLSSAPLSPEQAASESFRKNSECCKDIAAAVKLANGDEFILVNVKEVAAYFLCDWCNLSEKTRSIIQLSFSMLVRNFLTKPLYRIFSTDTTFRPENMFDSKIIVLNLPVQLYKNVGVAAGILLKYISQLAIMRRSEVKDGPYLRPCFIYSDEAQNFISDFDYIFQSVARSAAGCTCYIVQSRETFIAKLGNEYKIDSLLQNLVLKIHCQNTGKTNTWASELIGERYEDIASTSVNRNGQEVSSNSGVSISEQLRAWIEPSRFTTLKRGGKANDYKVEAIVFKGGEIFSDGKPYSLVTIDQR